MSSLARKSVLLLMIYYLLLATIAACVYGACDSQEFKVVEECVCPGSTTAVYKCTAVGNGFTQWSGTAFNCPNSGNEIFLSHTDFDNGIRKECNNGAIIGQSLQVNGSCFISQLTVNTSINLNGTTIGCTYEIGNTLELIGVAALTSSTDSLSPPKNVRLLHVSPGVLMFSWTPTPLNCSAATYEIQSSCGECPTLTNSTMVICIMHNPLVQYRMCRFAVRTVICNNTVGGWSNKIEVILRVPKPPPFTKISSRYDPTNLLGLDVQFSHLSGDSFNISDGIDGSVLCYTVTFNDSVTSEMCASIVISPASCSDICATSLPLSCFPLRGNIIVSVSATNVLGKGPTNSVIIGNTNQYVNVTAESTGRITCTFLNQRDVQMEKSCNVLYGQCAEPLSYSNTIANGSGSIAVQHGIESDVQDYCYATIANNDTFSVLIEGTFSSTLSGPSSMSNKSQVIAIGVLVPIAVMIIIILLVIVAVFVRLKVKYVQFQRTKGGFVKAHICFTLEDKPNQLLNALSTLTDPEIKFNIRNIIIGPLQDKKRRIYIENENHLSDTDRESIKKKIAVDGHTLEDLEIFLESESKFISTRTEKYQTREMRMITEVLEHQPGALCGLIKAVLSIDDNSKCTHINIIDIMVEDEETKRKRVTIKFIPVLKDDWETKYNVNKRQCKFIVENDSTSL